MRSWFLITLFVSGCAAGPVYRSDACAASRSWTPAQRLLVGTWRRNAAASTLVVNGKLQKPEIIPETLWQYHCDGTFQVTQGTYQSSGTFKWKDATEISETIVESTAAFQIGLSTSYSIAVDASTLELKRHSVDWATDGVILDTVATTRFERVGSGGSR